MSLSMPFNPHSGAIYLRSKSYLVVKISSDKVKISSIAVMYAFYLYDTIIISCLVSYVHFTCIVHHSLNHKMDIGTIRHCALVSSTPSQSLGLVFGC